MARPSNVVTANPHKKPHLFRRTRKLGSNDAHEETGLTLGDLDVIESEKQSSNNLNYQYINNFVEPDRESYYNQKPNALDYNPSDVESVPNEQKRSMRKINLDLSGRIMCHMFSPRRSVEESTNPLLCPHHVDEGRSTIRGLKRMLPRFYIGANYDLDETWYGATRWIGKCSWGPPTVDHKIQQIDLFSFHPIVKRAMNLAGVIFPTNDLNSITNWDLDVEREQSVFDSSDTTMRISMVQPRRSIPSRNASQNKFLCALQKVTLEYDSAKYFQDCYSANSSRFLQYSPILNINIQTPLCHPRVEFNSKKTWIVKNGGDRNGNYYGGNYYGSNSPAEQRRDQIKALYRNRIPQSDQTTHQTQRSNTSFAKATCNKISAWLENDGWMPQKVTTDLMGNLVAVNSLGFGGNSNDSCTPRNRMGLRISISKKIDWSRLGIFPWSNNSYENLREKQNVDKKSARVRVELCGLNASEDRRVWAAIDTDLFNAVDTCKVIIGHESVAA